MNQSTNVLVEHLTRRELNILAYLGEGKSNNEIAALETLALPSVKWYIQQIYAKLGVNKRSQAVARAHELHLLRVDSGEASNLYPPPRVKHNLPASLTSFIGRQKEIAELCLLLKKKETRLLTLTGSGGTGKTRLSLQVGFELLDAFPDGVWLVELAHQIDPLLVPQTVILALGQAEQTGKLPTSQLANYLREKQLLLILDNCEHLVTACAELAAVLLQGAPHLKILASSREILGVAGEIPYRVPPLEMPDPLRLPDLEELGRLEAVRLFIERAQLVNSQFTLAEDNAASIAQITRRLDGIPLALELAAARVRLLSVEQIAQHLNDALWLLTGGNRTAPSRHQTLTASIEWSYNLLSDAEGGLLRSLSVFVGDWTLEAAEEVRAGERIPAQSILNLLGQLADKSLILAETGQGGEPRFRMLETIRQYAHARLVEEGEDDALHRLHLAYYLRLAERLEPRLHSREQIASLDELGRELDNLRQALEWALEVDVETELRLASALQWFWDIRFHLAEGILWLSQGLEVEALQRGSLPLQGARAGLRARALTALGYLKWMTQRDHILNVKNPLEESLMLYRTSAWEDRRGLAWALERFGYLIILEGSLTEGIVLIEEALSLFREIPDVYGMAECLHVLGESEKDTTQGRKIFMEMLSIDQANGDIEATAKAYFDLGILAFKDGDPESAYTAFAESREYSRRVGNPLFVTVLEIFLGSAAQFKGDLECAAVHLEEALAGFRENVDNGYIAECLFYKCLNAFGQGRYDKAAEITEEVADLAQMTGDAEILNTMLYLRARLARLRGNMNAARIFTEQAFITGLDGRDITMWLLIEQGYLALYEGDVARAGVLWRQALNTVFVINIPRRRVASPLDVMAVLAVREGRFERAARLYETPLARWAANLHSPIEREAREADLAQIKTALGAERFTQLQAEGRALTFQQVLALIQAED